MVVGGSDMPQQYVSIHSITPGSPADLSGLLRPGDELVMCGNECLMGLSWKEAQGIVNSVPETFTVVVQRKASVSAPVPQQRQQQQQQQQQQHQQQQRGRDKEADKRLSVASEDSFISYNTVESSTNLIPSSQPLAEEKDPTQTPSRDPDLSESFASRDTPSRDLELSGSFASRDNSSVFNSPSKFHSSFESSLNDVQDESVTGMMTIEEHAMACARMDEEVYQIELQKQEGRTLGFVIAGGDKVTPDIYVKRIVPNSIASADGRLKVGDRVMFMNETKIIGLSKLEATNVLRSADTVNLIVARRPPVTGSALNTPAGSTTTSRQGSPVRQRRMSESQISRQESSGTMRRRHRRSDSLASIHSVGKQKMSDSVSSLHSINEDFEMSTGLTSTLPRDVGSRRGVKMVELMKGSTGLGMKIIGGKDQPKPFVVRDVFPGGPAAKCGKIFPNDQILEVNGKSFDGLIHRDAIKFLQSIPLGKVQVLLRSAEYVKVS
jgi:C-terminal processing protease CtpA/Prc